MKRRNFLKAASVLTLPVLIKGFEVEAMTQTPLLNLLGQQALNSGRVLVLVQLNGGNDGLNTVLSLDRYGDLSNARSNILIPQYRGLTLNNINNAALNPAMPEMQSLINNGLMNVVQGVSYPNPSFSHFRATDIWLTGASSDQYLSTGWLGRTIDEQYAGYPNSEPGYPLTKNFFMGNTMQRRQFLSRLSTKGHKPQPNNASSQTAEKSFQPADKPVALLKTEGVQSGIAQYTGEWTEKQMVHLLRRTMFGAAKASVDKIKSMTMSQAVDFLINNPVLPTSSPLNVYTTGVDTGGVAFGSSWIDANLPDPTDSTVKNTLNNNRLTNSFKPWWMGLMINQQTHILEKMTLFWSNHFGTDNNNNNRPKAIFQHYKILRKYGLGNFRDLLKQVTIDPHMLYFLSGYFSTKGAPNENYGRELQELFTVGKGPDSKYTEDDVKAAARTLTGWTVSQSTTDGTYSSAYTASRHDTNVKQFSAFYNNKKIDAQTAADVANDVDTLIDMILKTNECAKFIVRRLYMWFVYSDINADVEANVITPLANIFRTSNYDIPTVLKALFKSEHFFNDLNYGSIIKSPVDLYVSMVREFNVTLAAAPVDIMYQHWKNIYDKARLEGQAIGDPPNVAGWTAYYVSPTFYDLWMSPSSIQTKATNLKAFANAGVKVGGVNIVIDSVAFNKQFADAGDPNAVVRNFIQYLLPVDDLTTEQKAAMKAFLVPPNESDTYWSNEWNRYLASPSTYYTEVKGVLDQLMRPIVAMAEYYLY